ncbi:MAG TPA: hypothetical protein VFE24_03980 [Pirellulales bacterium]|nr:hypothetical protein [Pirellulales bacterium]
MKACCLRWLLLPACLLPLLWASPAAAATLENIKITSDQAPDCSSLKAIVASVTRDCKTDDERAIALYNFCRYAYYHHAYPQEDDEISALKLLNVYGWSLCGGEHTVLAALYEAAGFKWRYRGWSNPGHTTVEAYYGGRWHYLDTFLKFYSWMPDPAHPGQRTIAGQEDIRANNSIVTDQFVLDASRNVCYQKDNAFAYIGKKVNWTAPAFMDCGDDLPGLLSGIKSSNNSGSPRGWAGIKFDDADYSTAVNLAAGYRLTLDWDHYAGDWYFRGSKTWPQHTCGNKEYRNSPEIGPLLEPYAFKDGKRTWSNGKLTFAPDLSNGAFLADLKEAHNATVAKGQLQPQDPSQPARLTIEMASPYVVAKVTSEIQGGAGLQAELSTDGKKWAPLELAKLSDAVAGKYRYLLRLTFSKPITALDLTSIVQHNQQSLPYLAPGENTITVSADNPAALGKNRLAITYAYCVGSRRDTPEQIFDAGGQIASGGHASWSTTPIVVQTIVDKLPATIHIPVPTPRANQPVYPKMVFLRREVLAPGQQPLATPVAPSQPKAEPGEVLATLPNPWIMGARAPAAVPKGPTKTATLTPTATSYVSVDGEAVDYHAVRWPKENKEMWVLLARFDAAQLPSADQFQEAKLILSVREAHDKAPSQAAAALLDAPFKPKEKFDFGKLGRTVGTTIIAKGDGPGAQFNPAKTYSIDVSAAVRTWIKQGQCNGLAVRIVPNRAVDDGWTVRFSLDKEQPLQLQIVTAVAK